MSVVQATGLGGGRSAPAEAAADVPGRIDVRERVVRKLSEQVAAQAIGVPVDAVRVTASDYRDGVAVRIDAPVPVPSLTDTEAIRSMGAVVDAAREMQRVVQDELARVLGKPVTRVDITISGATTPTRRRVR